jgi:hypothetical protein
VNIDLARIQYLSVIPGSRPNVADMEQRCPRATSLPLLDIAALALHELPVVMIVQMPKHQSEMTMVALRSTALILNVQFVMRIR